MKISKVLYIEDSANKFMDVAGYLKRQGISVLDWATDAERAMDMIDKAFSECAPYDLIVSDMHFDYFGVTDEKAGEKTMSLIREKGYDTPIIFCSSENVKIPGAVGNIFYHPKRDWESEVNDLLGKIEYNLN